MLPLLSPVRRKNEELFLPRIFKIDLMDMKSKLKGANEVLHCNVRFLGVELLILKSWQNAYCACAVASSSLLIPLFSLANESYGDLEVSFILALQAPSSCALNFVDISYIRPMLVGPISKVISRDNRYKFTKFVACLISRNNFCPFPLYFVENFSFMDM